jgi:hypothetical protein
MSRSDQLGLRCIVEPNYSSLSTRLAGVSVTRNRALGTCEPNYVPRVATHFFIPVVHSPLGPGVRGSIGALLSGRRGRGHMAMPEPTSTKRRGPELRNTWQHYSSPLGEAEPGAMGHVAAPEPTSAGRRGPRSRDTWQHRSSPQQGGDVRSRGTRDGSGAHLCREVWSKATAYVTAYGCTSCYLS